MNGLSCSHYDSADTDDGTGRDRAEKPDLTCVHCYSFNPEGVTPPFGESDDDRGIFTSVEPADADIYFVCLYNFHRG